MEDMCADTDSQVIRHAVNISRRVVLKALDKPLTESHIVMNQRTQAAVHWCLHRNKTYWKTGYCQRTEKFKAQQKTEKRT